MLRKQTLTDRTKLTIAKPKTNNGLMLAGFISPADLAYDEPVDRMDFHFGVSRRAFVQVLGAGLLIAICDSPLAAQEGEAPAGRRGGNRGGRGGGGFMGGGPVPIAARLHIGKDGEITVFTGKVECGQGADRVDPSRRRRAAGAGRSNHAGHGGTALVPDDGMTAGSGTTPNTVPAIRQAPRRRAIY